MPRRAVVILATVLLSACAPATAIPTGAPAGIVVLTAAGSPFDDVTDRMPSRLDLHISAGRTLTPGDAVITFDGTDVMATAQRDGSLSASTAAAAALGSRHHLSVRVAGQQIADDDITIIDVTDVAAAVYDDATTVSADVIFSNPPLQSAVPIPAAATSLWTDATHLHLTWPRGGEPATLTVPVSTAILRGSRMAAALSLPLDPLPGSGSLRRVVTPAAATPQPASVVGYAVGTAASRAAVAAHADRIDVISPAGWRVHGDGNVGGAPDPADVTAARAAGAAVMPLVQNDATDASGTAALLDSGSARAAFVARIAALTVAGGYTGIDLDIEGIAATDRDAFTALVRDLASRFAAQHLRLDVDVVPHKPGHLNVYSAAYDVPAIAEAAAHVVLMAYDQHTSSTGAGPVAGADWDAQLLDGSAQSIDPAKVILGMPLYARTWHGATAVSDQYAASVAAALATPGVRTDYDFAAATPSLLYTPADGGGPAVCYFDDALSLQAKLQLASSRHLAGVALWRLGFEDPEIWNAIPARR